MGKYSILPRLCLLLHITVDVEIHVARLYIVREIKEISVT